MKPAPIRGATATCAPGKGGLLDTLFDLDGPSEFDRDGLKARLDALAARSIRIGGSSWKYEGWLGQIYSPSRYRTRGKFSKKLFEETCLNEYATVFPTVCGDFAFYQFPTMSFWEKLFRQTPASFRWGFKIPEQITVPAWPMHRRYGALAGRENPAFLDSELLENSLLRALAPWKSQVGVLIFEFGAMRQASLSSPDGFVKALDPFLDRLPGSWPYAIEVRNPEFLAPDYFACLRAHGVSHVYNAWTRMPELADQIAIREMAEETQRRLDDQTRTRLFVGPAPEQPAVKRLRDLANRLACEQAQLDARRTDAEPPLILTPLRRRKSDRMALPGLMDLATANDRV